MAGKVDDAALGRLIEKLARAAEARKALAIGRADRHGWLVSLARGLHAEGVLIVLYPDREGMRLLRAEFDRAGVASRANVMLGNPALLVRKVAGPFDIVVNCDAGDAAAWQARLAPLVARDGVLITPWEGGIAIVAGPAGRSGRDALG